MTQLILDTNGLNIVLPESKKNGYTANKQPLYVDVQMVTGRLVRELRGNVWVVSYQYGFFDDDTKNRLIEVCEKGQREPITCGFLPPKSVNELQYSEFLVTDFQTPKFMWSRHETSPDGKTDVPVPVWVDFAVTLREVNPND